MSFPFYLSRSFLDSPLDTDASKDRLSLENALALQTVTTSDGLVFFTFPAAWQGVYEILVELPLFRDMLPKQHIFSTSLPSSCTVERDLSKVLSVLKTELNPIDSYASLDDFHSDHIRIFKKLVSFLRFLDRPKKPVTVPYTSEQLLEVFGILEYPGRFIMRRWGRAFFDFYVKHLSQPQKDRQTISALISSDFLYTKRVRTNDGYILYIPRSMYWPIEDFCDALETKLSEFRESGTLPQPEDAENPCKDIPSLVPYISSHIHKQRCASTDAGLCRYYFCFSCFMKPLEVLWNDDREVSVPIDARDLRRILGTLGNPMQMLMGRSAYTALLCLINQLDLQLYYLVP
jgi:hypothetical protein